MIFFLLCVKIKKYIEYYGIKQGIVQEKRDVYGAQGIMAV